MPNLRPPTRSDEHHVDLSVIIVSWNVRELLRDCLASLRSSPGFAVEGAKDEAEAGRPACLTGEVIVVDNDSRDGSAQMLAHEFPWVRLVVSDRNLGFTAGNNRGLQISRGRHVLFLNPDTVVTGNALLTLVTYLEAHPHVGIVGPELHYGDGSIQPSRRRFPTFASGLFESTPLAWRLPTNRWAHHYHMDDRQADHAQVVDWVVGAAMLVRGEVLETIGGFDEGFFMYSEELDLCRRAANGGWQTAFLPAARIIHFEGRSSDQVAAARHIHFQRSKVRYFRKHHGALTAETLRVFLLASFAGEWFLEGAKWLLGSRRTLRRERMRAYAQLLRTKLQ